MARCYIREGANQWGKIIANIDTETKQIREGSSYYGDIIAHIDGDRIREGAYSYGTTSYGLFENEIRGGNGIFGKIAGRICYENGYVYIREGNSTFGRIIANLTKD